MKKIIMVLLGLVWLVEGGGLYEAFKKGVLKEREAIWYWWSGRPVGVPCHLAKLWYQTHDGKTLFLLDEDSLTIARSAGHEAYALFIKSKVEEKVKEINKGLERYGDYLDYDEKVSLIIDVAVPLQSDLKDTLDTFIWHLWTKKKYGIEGVSWKQYVREVIKGVRIVRRRGDKFERVFNSRVGW